MLNLKGGTSLMTFADLLQWGISRSVMSTSAIGPGVTAQPGGIQVSDGARPRTVPADLEMSTLLCAELRKKAGRCSSEKSLGALLSGPGIPVSPSLSSFPEAFCDGVELDVRPSFDRLPVKGSLFRVSSDTVLTRTRSDLGDRAEEVDPEDGFLGFTPSQFFFDTQPKRSLITLAPRLPVAVTKIPARTDLRAKPSPPKDKLNTRQFLSIKMNKWRKNRKDLTKESLLEESLRNRERLRLRIGGAPSYLADGLNVKRGDPDESLSQTGSVDIDGNLDQKIPYKTPLDLDFTFIEGAFGQPAEKSFCSESSSKPPPGGRKPTRGKSTPGGSNPGPKLPSVDVKTETTIKCCSGNGDTQLIITETQKYLDKRFPYPFKTETTLEVKGSQTALAEAINAIEKSKEKIISLNDASTKRVNPMELNHMLSRKTIPGKNAGEDPNVVKIHPKIKPKSSTSLNVLSVKKSVYRAKPKPKEKEQPRKPDQAKPAAPSKKINWSSKRNRGRRFVKPLIELNPIAPESNETKSSQKIDLGASQPEEEGLSARDQQILRQYISENVKKSMREVRQAETPKSTLQGKKSPGYIPSRRQEMLTNDKKEESKSDDKAKTFSSSEVLSEPLDPVIKKGTNSDSKPDEQPKDKVGEKTNFEDGPFKEYMDHVQKKFHEADGKGLGKEYVTVFKKDPAETAHPDKPSKPESRSSSKTEEKAIGTPNLESVDTQANPDPKTAVLLYPEPKTTSEHKFAKETKTKPSPVSTLIDGKNDVGYANQYPPPQYVYHNPKPEEKHQKLAFPLKPQESDGTEDLPKVESLHKESEAEQAAESEAGQAAEYEAGQAAQPETSENLSEKTENNVPEESPMVEPSVASEAPVVPETKFVDELPSRIKTHSEPPAEPPIPHTPVAPMPPDFVKLSLESEPLLGNFSSLQCKVGLKKVPEFPMRNPKPFKMSPPESIISIKGSSDLLLRKKLLTMPSVTKILNETMAEKSREALARWKNDMIAKLGDSGFQEFYQEQLQKGSGFHSSVQKYLRGDATVDMEQPPLASLHNVLKNISDVSVLESQVVHPQLAYRGVVDCIAKYRDKRVIIEWKKSDKPKPTMRHLYDAPVQLCAYLGALNFDQNYSLDIEGGLVVVAYSDGSPADTFNMSLEECEIHWKVWLQRLHQFLLAH